MKFKAAIFDLDGTLLDTLDDLADSANAALARHGFPGHAACAYKLFIGNGVKTLLRRAAPAGTGEDKALLEDLVAEFGREYQARWKAKTKPYPEILETLEKLEQKGVKLAVLSNKPHDFAQLMVNDFFPSTGFAVIFGARPGVPLKPAPDAAFEAAGVLDCPVGEVMLVGDSGMDMRAASQAKMAAVGVLWGFREAPELLENGASYLISQPGQLLDVLEHKHALIDAS